MYIVLAAFAWSTAGFLQHDLSVSIGTQIAMRALFATVALLPFVAYATGSLARAFRSIRGTELAVAVCAAAASSLFMTALNYTSVANVLVLQAGAPLIAAVVAKVTLNEELTRPTLIAVPLAMAGIVLMVGGSGSVRWLGSILAAATAVAFALVIVITRHRRDVSMAPAICCSQFVVFVVASPFAHLASVDLHELVILVVLGIGQLGLGFALLTIGARLIPATEVALLSLLEIVLGPLWVWLASAERPTLATIAGGAVVVIAITYHAVGNRRAKRSSPLSPPSTLPPESG